MPNYDYDCRACGPFTAMRPMAAFRDPCACPTCGTAAPRTLLRAPSIAGMAAARRSAFAADEARAGSGAPPKATHPAGCGCCVRRSPLPAALASSDRVFSSNGPLSRSGR